MLGLNLNTNKVYIGQTESTILPLIIKLHKYYLTSPLKLTMRQLQASRVCQPENENERWNAPW